jgi:hypothetical protein
MSILIGASLPIASILEYVLLGLILNAWADSVIK